MSFAATADPERFEEAVDWFRSQFPLTEELLEALGEYAGPRAWVIAGVAELDVVTTVYAALLEAIANNEDFREFKVKVGASLAQAWGKSSSQRIQVIFRTNVQKAYNRGRWMQMHDPDVLPFRPFGMYDAILDGRETEICHDLDGTILPLNDPRWVVPPAHHQCRSSIRSLRRAEAERRGITTDLPIVDIPAGFGSIPGANEWVPNADDYPPELWAEFQSKRARAESA